MVATSHLESATPQVALLRQRLKVELPSNGATPPDETFYDETLKAAVVAFQKEHGMAPDGIVGNATRAAYFTTWVDDAGQLQTARDVYGHEQRIKLALAGKWGEIVKGPNHLAPVTVDPDVRASIYRNTRPNTVGDYVQSVLGGGF